MDDAWSEVRLRQRKVGVFLADSWRSALAAAPACLITAFVSGVVVTVLLACVPLWLSFGPHESGLVEMTASVGTALDVWTDNLLTLLVVGAAPALGLSWMIGKDLRSGSLTRRRAERGLFLVPAALALIGALYFANGVDWLGDYCSVSRWHLLVVLVHGYIELPALLLPTWSVAIIYNTQHRAPWGSLWFVLASVFLLLAAAFVEAFVTSGLINGLDPPWC